MMKLFIKNMVCARCIRTVRNIMSDAGVDVDDVQLGEVVITSPLTDVQKMLLINAFHDEGFELLDDKHSRIVERIKNLVISEIHYQQGMKKETVNFSDFLAGELGHDYSFLSKLFSAVEGITIEKYIITQKIERVKELIIYDEMNLQEISYQLNYSSSQHLSNQFRQVTGMTPTEFRQTHSHARRHLDHI